MSEFDQRQITGIAQLYRETFRWSHRRFLRGNRRMARWDTYVSPLRYLQHRINRLSALKPRVRVALVLARWTALMSAVVGVLAAVAIVTTVVQGPARLPAIHPGQGNSAVLQQGPLGHVAIK